MEFALSPMNESLVKWQHPLIIYFLLNVTTFGGFILLGEGGYVNGRPVKLNVNMEVDRNRA